METMTAQLALDLPFDPEPFAPQPFDACDEADGQRLATVHRLFADVLAAEPAVVSEVRRSAASKSATASVVAPIDLRGASTVRRPVPPVVYRRRRLVVAVALGLLASALSLLGGELAGRITGTPGIPVVGASVEPTSHIVQPGDTLWSIARAIGPEGVDVRSTVDRLVEANGGPLLRVGQRIVLPAG